MCAAPRNGILYKIPGRRSLYVFVSETKLNRDLSQVVTGAEDVRTAIFPNTTKMVSDGAFQATHLRSVILNEGLVSVGACIDVDDRNGNEKGVFCNTQIK